MDRDGAAIDRDGAVMDSSLKPRCESIGVRRMSCHGGHVRLLAMVKKKIPVVIWIDKSTNTITKRRSDFFWVNYDLPPVFWSNTLLRPLHLKNIFIHSYIL